MIAIKIIEGYLDVCWEETAIYSNKKMLMKDNIGFLTDLLEEFDDKKVRITVEEIE